MFQSFRKKSIHQILPGDNPRDPTGVVHNSQVPEPEDPEHGVGPVEAEPLRDVDRAPVDEPHQGDPHLSLAVGGDQRLLQ